MHLYPQSCAYTSIQGEAIINYRRRGISLQLKYPKNPSVVRNFGGWDFQRYRKEKLIYSYTVSAEIMTSNSIVTAAICLAVE